MNSMIRILYLILFSECVGLGWYVSQREEALDPVLPQLKFDDPLLAEAFQEYADQAKSGGSEDWQILGETLLGQGFYGEAELAFRQAVQLDAQNSRAHFGLAFCLERTGRMELSNIEYLQASEILRNSDEAVTSPSHCLYQAGKNFLRLEDETQARKLFEQNRQFSPATYQLVKLLSRTGEKEEALKIIESVLDQAPTSLKFNSLYLSIMEEQGDLQAAFKARQRLEYAQRFVPIDFNTKYVTPFSLQAGFPKRLQEYNRALGTGNMELVARKLNSLYKIVEHTNMPARAQLQQSLAEVEFQRRQPKRILESIAILDSLGVQSAERLQMEGAAYALQDQLDKAAELWERAALMSPNIPLHQMLAKYYDQQELTSKRDHHLGQAALLAAKIEYWSHRPESAKSEILRAIEIIPEDDEVWFYLAEIDMALNQVPDALTAYRTCLEKNPYHGRAKLALELFEDK